MKIPRETKGRPKFRQPDIPPLPLSGSVKAELIGILRAAWIPAIIFLVPVLIFWPTLGVGFVSDDFLYHGVFSGTIRDFLIKASLIQGGEGTIPEFFRPVGLLSLKLDYLIWGADPIGFHLSNILLHSLNSLILFAILIRFGLGKSGSAIAALLFAVYPLNSEPVSWISGRFDLLAATFILLTLYCWTLSRLNNDARWMIPAVISFILGILSKENAAAGIFLLPLVDFFLHLKTRKEWGTGTGFFWQWYIIFAAAVIVFVGFRLFYFGDIGGYSDVTNRATYFNIPFSVLTVNLIGENFKMLLSPVSRILWSEWNPVIRQFLMLAGVLFWAGLAVGLIQSILKSQKFDESPLALILGGIIWAFVMMLPTLPIEGVQDSMNCSRFLYLPLTGFVIWAGIAVGSGFDSGKISPPRVVIAILVLLASGFTLVEHNKTWLEAGRVAGRINTVMETHTANLPDNAAIFTINHPLLWKGASCSPLKYDWYVEYIHGKSGINTIEMRMNPEEIDEWWTALSENYSRPGIGFAWDETSQAVEVLPMFIPADPGNSAQIESISPVVPPEPTEPELEISTVNEEEAVTDVDIFAEPG